ncbi:DUF4333 domain-containing protein [Gulosibacter macacae]|uniref:DUF4333 domain-containing protein n=1 Tax=Gulosibacter macacae TaxID=2488791 RepID=A0A3P3VYV6_9MICO|nr:DUF4333 domain-containing protein [Gulosibacter macacae]RRJ86619.1 DUF4333 domain-containing protein [Gulosibacter macacae]
MNSNESGGGETPRTPGTHSWNGSLRPDAAGQTGQARQTSSASSASSAGQSKQPGQSAQPEQAPGASPYRPATPSQSSAPRHSATPSHQGSWQSMPTSPAAPGQPQAPRPQQSPLGGSSAPSIPATPQYGRPQAPGAGSYSPQRPTASPLGGTSTTQYGQPPVASYQPTSSSKKKKSGRGAIVMLSLLLPIGIALGGVAGYFLAHQINSLDEAKVESKVAQVLREDFGMSDLATVNCPAWVKVEQGASFQCEFEYAGTMQTVTVTQGAQSGQLVVGAPSAN